LMYDVFVVKFELRDRYGDVGHHLLVQDAPSLIQKYVKLIHCWSLFEFLYISEKCMCSPRPKCGVLVFEGKPPQNRRREHTQHLTHPTRTTHNTQHTTYTTHNTQHTTHSTHNTQHTTHNTQHTTHYIYTITSTTSTDCSSSVPVRQVYNKHIINIHGADLPPKKWLCLFLRCAC
jgi:hypothetical protein